VNDSAQTPEKLGVGTREWDDHCDTHGPYRARGFELNGKRMGGRCPNCQRERDAEEQSNQEAKKRAAKAKRVERLLGSAGIPPRFLGRTFENFRVEPGNQGQAKALRLCKAYADRFDDAMASGACAVLIGPPGTGKTHLAAAIAQAIIPTGRSVHFTTVSRLVRRVKSTYSQEADETEEQAIRAYRIPDLLILDEVGVQRGTETERLILTDVLGLRYEHMSPTVVLGNCSEPELAAHLGDRVVSRLQEGGGPFVVCNWLDYRTKVHADDGLPRRKVPPVDWEGPP